MPNLHIDSRDDIWYFLIALCRAISGRVIGFSSFGNNVHLAVEMFSQIRLPPIERQQKQAAKASPGTVKGSFARSCF